MATQSPQRPTLASTDDLAAAAAGTGAPAPTRNRARVVFPVLGGVLLVAGLTAWLFTRGRESTDDAFVETHVANVAARIQGQVLHVKVADNQVVAEGDVLVELDDRDARVRLAAARADLASAAANRAAFEAQLALVSQTIEATLKQAHGGIEQARSLTGSTQAGIKQARADVEAARARQHLAQTELSRTEKLHAEGALAVAELDVKRANFDQAQASLAQAEARLSAALAGVDNATGNVQNAEGRLLAARTGPTQVEAARAQVDVARARVAQAQAAVDQAELTLSYTLVRAPIHGVVSRRTVEPGQSVDPARPLLSITGLDDTWVVANFKEDQLGDMHAGQPARVKIDTYRGQSFAAHVDSVAGGTGSRFALLPPDNASGNFTKVVQRVPVLIRFDGKLAVALRPGMSAYVTVTTRD